MSSDSDEREDVSSVVMIDRDVTLEVAEWLESSDGRVRDIFDLWTHGKRTTLWAAVKLIEEGHLDLLNEMVA